MAASSFYAIIAGAGAGTGRALALKFAEFYPTVYILSRSASSYDPIIAEIASSEKTRNCKAIGISTSVTSSDEVKAAFSQIKEANKGNHLAAAIFNVGGEFFRSPFLELSEDKFTAGFAASGTGLYNFSQATLPLLLEAVQAKPTYPPSLLVTGATASLRGGPQLASIAVGKSAMRTMTQSLAKEFWPQGVHIAHAIIDGVIDTPKYQSGIYGFKPNSGKEDGVIDPHGIADTYWFLHTQRRSAWTHELEIRPYCEEKW